MTWCFASCSQNLENNELHRKLPIESNWNKYCCCFAAAICMSLSFHLFELRNFWFFFLKCSIALNAHVGLVIFSLRNGKLSTHRWKWLLFLNEFRAHVCVYMFRDAAKNLKINFKFDKTHTKHRTWVAAASKVHASINWPCVYLTC